MTTSVTRQAARRISPLLTVALVLSTALASAPAASVASTASGSVGHVRVVAMRVTSSVQSSYDG